MKIRGLLKASLRAIGAIDPHNVPTNQELTDTLEAMDLMLENWFVDGLTVYVGKEENFSLSSGTSTYTIGDGGAFDTDRPYNILGAFIRSSGYDYPVDIITASEFNSIFDKSLTGMPWKLSFLPESPLGLVRLYFTPDAAYDLHIQSQKPLAEITDLDADISFEQGYKAAIKWNLAVELAPEWGVELSQVVAAKAIETKNRIIALNAARQTAPVKLDLFGESRRYSYDAESYV